MEYTVLLIENIVINNVFVKQKLWSLCPTPVLTLTLNTLGLIVLFSLTMLTVG